MSGWTPAALGALTRGDLSNALIASTPGGIERQEAQGQIAATKHKDRVPRFGGGYRQSDEDEAALRADAETFGFVYGEPLDDLFVSVTFPEGWKFDPTGHSMHNDLLDEKGRKRGSMFYKAAFYDRKADMSFLPRFTLREVKPDNWFELENPEQPEKLFTSKKVRRQITEDQYERLQYEHPRMKFDIEHSFSFFDGKRRGKTYDNYDPYYDRFGDIPGGRQVRTIYAHVEEKTYLPDDKQPAEIPAQTYPVHYEFYDRLLDKVIYISESYTHVLYSHKDSGGENVFVGDEIGKSIWDVEDARKERVLDPINALIEKNYPNHNDLSLWLSENPYPPADKPRSVISDDLIGGDSTVHAVNVWAKCMNVSFTVLKAGGKFFAIFPELWMKLEFDRRFGK